MQTIKNTVNGTLSAVSESTQRVPETLSSIGSESTQPEESPKVQPEAYDFIVVGGGTAGLCVAGRLAENPDLSILVIEAGPDNPLDVPEIATPALAFQLVESKYDWQYPATLYDHGKYKRSEPQNTRGKVLGGSSCLNYYTWIRGSRETYDEWEYYGGQEWKWDNCLDYFQKAASFHDDNRILPHDPTNVAAKGPLDVNPAIPISLAEPITKAWTSQGHKLSEDIYGGKVDGLVHLVHTIHQGQRVPSTRFIQGKSNITIKANTMVHRILFSGNNAVGIQCSPTNGNDMQKFYAKHEVILSGGVFESPKMLMLSGIGPKNDFSPLTAVTNGLKKQVLSPHVGQNLQDHPVCPHSFRVKDGMGMDHVMRPGPEHEKAALQYKTTKTGPMCSALLEFSGFARGDSRLQQCKEWREQKERNNGDDPLAPQGQPHWEFDFLPVFASPFLPHVDEPQEGDYLTVVVSLLRPMSRGSVTLRSANANDYPIINYNYLDNPVDLVGLREGVRFVDEVILRGDGLRDEIIGEYPKEVPRNSDQEMEEWVHERVTSGYHPCGTCRMGKDISEGVVDGGLNVHGVKRLRVVDASVFPIIPDARIQNPVYMVAEKAADMIKRDHPGLFAVPPSKGLSKLSIS